MNNDKKNIRQRIIDAHLNVLTQRFCDIINKYYGTAVAYHERCKTELDDQFQIDLNIDLFNNEQPFLYPQV